MSRVGLAPIALKDGVETNINGQTVEVKGPKGTMTVEIPEPITASVEDNELRVARPSDHRKHRALHGLSRSLLNNAVVGVTEGYTHPVLIEAPEGITFATDGPTKLSITGIDKQAVGQVAANIRRLRKDDPYNGKGIRYEGEQIRRKVGKAGK